MPRSRPWSVALAAALICQTAPAWASGTMRMPEMNQKMESFRACLAFLEARAAEDAARAAPMTIDAKGDRKSVSVERRSEGIERKGKSTARYAARIWYSFGRPRPDLGQIEFSTSWEEHDYQCRGRALISNTAQGYTLSSFVPMESEGEPKNPPPKAE